MADMKKVYEDLIIINLYVRLYDLLQILFENAMVFHKFSNSTLKHFCL